MSVAPPTSTELKKLNIVTKAEYCEYCENFANFVDSFNPPSRRSDAWPRTASWPLSSDLAPALVITLRP